MSADNSYTQQPNFNKQATDAPEREFRSRGAARTTRGRPSLPNVSMSNGETVENPPAEQAAAGRGRGRGQGTGVAGGGGMVRGAPGGPPQLQRRSTISGGGPPMNLVTGEPQPQPPNRQLPQPPGNKPPERPLPQPNRQLPQPPGDRQLPQPPGDVQQPPNRQLPQPPAGDRPLPPSPAGNNTGRPPNLPTRPQSVRVRSATTTELPTPPSFMGGIADKPSRPPPSVPTDTPPNRPPPRPPAKPEELKAQPALPPRSEAPRREVQSFIMSKSASTSSVPTPSNNPPINRDSFALKLPAQDNTDLKPRSGSQSHRGPRPGPPPTPQKPKELEPAKPTPPVVETSLKLPIPTTAAPNNDFRPKSGSQSHRGPRPGLPPTPQKPKEYEYQEEPHSRGFPAPPKQEEPPKPPPRTPENQRRKPAPGNPPALPWREELESSKPDQSELQSLRERLNGLPSMASLALQKKASLDEEFSQLTEKMNDANDAISSALHIRREAERIAANFPQETQEILTQLESKTKQYQQELDKITKQLEAINKLLKASPSASTPAAPAGAGGIALAQAGHRNTVKLGPGGIRVREEYVKAKTDFTSPNPLQLSYTIGTVISIIDRFPTGWNKGSLPNGTIGFFQDENFVICDPSDPTSFFTSSPAPAPVPVAQQPVVQQPVVQQAQIALPSIQRPPQITEPITKSPLPATQRPVSVITQPVAQQQPVQQPVAILPVQQQPVPTPVVRGQPRPVSGIVERGRSNTVTNAPFLPTPAPAPKVPQARALYEFNKVNPTELELIKGEIVDVIQPNDLWTFVKGLNGQGYVPSNYLQPL